MVDDEPHGPRAGLVYLPMVNCGARIVLMSISCGQTSEESVNLKK